MAEAVFWVLREGHVEEINIIPFALTGYSFNMLSRLDSLLIGVCGAS